MKIVKGTVLRFGVKDSAGEMIDGPGMEVPDDVPVFMEFDREKPVGRAKLYKSEDKVDADITLNPIHTIVEDLGKILSSGGKVYPAVGGYVTGRKGDMVTNSRITSIGLSTSGNADPGIEPLKVDTEKK
jgi:hypothetical protein